MRLQRINHNYPDTFGEPGVKVVTRRNGEENEVDVYDNGTNDVRGRDECKH